MSLFADLLSALFQRRSIWGAVTAPAPGDRSLADLAADLLGTPGEVSGQSLARHMLSRYAAADDSEKIAFFHHLAHDMSISPAQIRTALDACEQGFSKSTYRAFMTAAEPRRQELIRRLNQVPGATGQLVAMRADLLRLTRNNPDAVEGGNPPSKHTKDALEALDLDFRHLFASWFNRGFLVLRPINWESPAHILEKIIAYEAVHAINDWEELRRRLQPEDRRCFAFFHPAMPDEPLIFVEVALTRGIPTNIHTLLAPPQSASPASQPSAGISAQSGGTAPPGARERAETAAVAETNPATTPTGIREQTDAPTYSLPSASTRERAQASEGGWGWGRTGGKGIISADTAVFYSISNCQFGLAGISFGNSLIKQVAADLSLELPKLKTFTTLSPIPGLCKWLQSQGHPFDPTDDANMLSLAARYLLTAKHKNSLPLDPVARFHLGNGAEIHQLHARADTSEKGMRQSAAVMVNYLYDLNRVAHNHEHFAATGEIAATAKIRSQSATATKYLTTESTPRQNTPRD